MSEFKVGKGWVAFLFFVVVALIGLSVYAETAQAQTWNGDSLIVNVNTTNQYISGNPFNQVLNTTSNVSFVNFSGDWIADGNGHFLHLYTSGDDLILNASNVVGNNYFGIKVGGVQGGEMKLYSNPNAGNGYLLWGVSELQGADTYINIYEGGTTHNRFWSSGSVRIGGGESYLCTNLTSVVDCDTPLTGADLVVQDDIWQGGSLWTKYINSSKINTTQINNTGTTTSLISRAREFMGRMAGSKNISCDDIGCVVNSALDLFIGGFEGTLTHANTDDRIYTLPDESGEVQVGAEWSANQNLNTSASPVFNVMNSTRAFVDRIGMLESTNPNIALQVIGDSGTGTDAYSGLSFAVYSASASSRSPIIFEKAGGTYTSPERIGNTSFMGRIEWRGHNGTQMMGSPNAYIRAYTPRNWTVGGYPVRIDFLTTRPDSTNAQYVMGLNEWGSVGINEQYPAYTLHLKYDSAGKPTTSVWTIVSDERAKANVVDYNKGLTELRQVQIHSFDYNGSFGIPKTNDSVGVLTQEIKQVFPNSVKKINYTYGCGDNNVSYYDAKSQTWQTEPLAKKCEVEVETFNAHEVIFAGLQAIKDLDAIVQQQQAEIDALDLRLKALEGKP